MSTNMGSYPSLLAEKAKRLGALQSRKPGEKGYKRRLREFLEADAAVERALLARIDDLDRSRKNSEPSDNRPAIAEGQTGPAIRS